MELPAPMLEQQLTSAIQTYLRDHLPSDLLLEPSAHDVRRIRTLLEVATASEATRIQEIALTCIQQATIAPGQIELKLEREDIAG